jgi:hypothetical protein
MYPYHDASLCITVYITTYYCDTLCRVVTDHLHIAQYSHGSFHNRSYVALRHLRLYVDLLPMD